MPNYHVQSLALGGATTWHISKILQKLGVKAEYCILYSGHNDRMQSSPRQSLAQLEKGIQPQSSGFTPWVLFLNYRHTWISWPIIVTRYLLWKNMLSLMRSPWMILSEH